MPLHCDRVLGTVVAIGLLVFSGCYAVGRSEGGGQQVASANRPRQVDPTDIAVPRGYRIEAVAQGLNFPTGVAFDDRGRPCVVESGYVYGEVFTKPRLLRVRGDGSTEVLAEGASNEGPWNGVAFAGGEFYVSDGGIVRPGGGRIIRIAQSGVTTTQPAGRWSISTIIENLPGRGDHHVNGPAVDSGGNVYFSIGTATNSGVVGTDNHQFGWLKRTPDFHDIPGGDIKLAGVNFRTENPLTDDPLDRVETGAYVAFGMVTEPGQVIKGQVPCTGGIFRLAGDRIELVAWGLRNPFGLAFAPDGRLFATDNSFDERGSRPVWGTGDLFWEIRQGVWYGWPDFHGQHPLTWSDRYAPRPGLVNQPRFLLAEHPNPPPKPAAVLGVHASACGLDFAPQSFGFGGQAFIAVFGDMADDVGKVLGPVGYHVVRVDPATGVIEEFAVNKGNKNGPASKLKTGGLERPVACRFDRDGNLYVVDFGILEMTGKGPRPMPNTGVLWRITREGAR